MKVGRCAVQDRSAASAESTPVSTSAVAMPALLPPRMSVSSLSPTTSGAFAPNRLAAVWKSGASGLPATSGSCPTAVRTAVGHDPLVAGKPEAPLFHTAASRLGAKAPLVVGDRLDTDILGGNNAGMATALVLTGVDSAEAALRSCTAQRPTFIIDSMAQLFTAYPDVTFDGGTVTCGAAAARTTTDSTGEQTVHIAGNPEDSDSWRAACAAWWAAVPDTEQATAPRLVWHTELP